MLYPLRAHRECVRVRVRVRVDGHLPARDHTHSRGAPSARMLGARVSGKLHAERVRHCRSRSYDGRRTRRRSRYSPSVLGTSHLGHEPEETLADTNQIPGTLSAKAATRQEAEGSRRDVTRFRGGLGARRAQAL